MDVPKDPRSNFSVLANSSVLVTLVVLLGLLIILPLGLPQIWGSSEARESHVASIVRQTGDWVLPDRNGFVPSKPILHHWLIVLSSFATGAVDEFSSRLPSAVLSILLVILLYRFSRQFFPRGQSTWQITVVAILLTTYGFARMMNTSMVDMTFAFFVCVATAAGFTAAFSEERRDGPWNLFFLASAFAVLTKGPLGLILPVSMVGAALWRTKGLATGLKIGFRPRAAWLLPLLLPLPWYYLAYKRAQGAFVERQLIFENVQRFFGGTNVNYEPFWFYIPSVLTRGAPWSWLLLALLVWYFKKRRTFDEPVKEPIEALLLAQGIALLFFSIASGKRHSYLLPLYPMFSLTLGCLMQLWLGRDKSLVDEARLTRMLTTVAKTLAGLTTVGTIVLLTYLQFSSDPALMLAAQWIYSNFFLLMVGPVVAVIYAFSRFRDTPAGINRTLCAFLAIFTLVLNLIYGIRGEFKDYRGMAQQLRETAPNGTVVAVRDRWDELLDPIFFYFGRRIEVVPPARFISSCKHDQLYIARKNLLSGYPQLRFGTLSEYREKVGNPKHIEDRAIVVFRCSPKTAA